MTKKITDSARGENCTIRIPGHCNHNPETTVFCHISGVRFGHGIGIKTNFGAYGCSSCHEIVDFRAYTEFNDSQIKQYHLEGVIETLIKLNDKGLIKL